MCQVCARDITDTFVTAMYTVHSDHILGIDLFRIEIHADQMCYVNAAYVYHRYKLANPPLNLQIRWHNLLLTIDLSIGYFGIVMLLNLCRLGRQGSRVKLVNRV